MPKRNGNKKKAIHFSDAEKLLIGLDKIAKSGSEDARTALSLSSWWLQNQSWTPKQWMFAKALVGRLNNKKKPKANRKYSLYAISDGNFVKLGFTHNIGSRLKALQTSQPNKLECVWRYYTGRSEVDARILEGKLHRYCKRHRIRGEWFNLSCLPLVEKFSAGNERKKVEIEEELDRKLLLESPL